MQRLLQTFEIPFIAADGETFDVLVLGNERPGDTWQGSLAFVRRGDGVRFETGVETTQPNADAIVYWASGLRSAYLDGAYRRARGAAHRRPAAPAVTTPPPLRDVAADRATYLHRLTALEQHILQTFELHATAQLDARTLLGELPHANADVVRALEDLEKQHQLVVRRTEGGSEWVVLTEAGTRAVGG